MISYGPNFVPDSKDTLGKHWNVHVVGGEKLSVAGDGAQTVGAGTAEGHFRVQCCRLSVNAIAHDVRIKPYLAWSPVRDPSDSHTLLAASGRVRKRFRQAIIRGCYSQRDCLS